MCGEPNFEIGGAGSDTGDRGVRTSIPMVPETPCGSQIVRPFTTRSTHSKPKWAVAPGARPDVDGLFDSNLTDHVIHGVGSVA